MLRNPAKDEGYWVALLLVTGGLWAGLEKALPQEVLVILTCVLVAVGVGLRLTVLGSWHRHTLPWTLDEEKLTLGDPGHSPVRH